VHFLEKEDILLAHDAILVTTGGHAGILQEGALDAALERCRWGPFHGEGDLTERAAYLLRGIVQDHPFVDGNKRTAFEAAALFFYRNGRLILAPADEVVSEMLHAAQGAGVQHIEAWLRRRAEAL